MRIDKPKRHAIPRLVWPRKCDTVEVRNVGSTGREICAEQAVLAELNRFFANELGINAIVSRPWLTRVAMPVAFHDFHQGWTIEIRNKLNRRISPKATTPWLTSVSADDNLTRMT